jgi:hypothetical protein
MPYVQRRPSGAQSGHARWAFPRSIAVASVPLKRAPTLTTNALPYTVGNTPGGKSSRRAKISGVSIVGGSFHRSSLIPVRSGATAIALDGRAEYAKGLRQHGTAIQGYGGGTQAPAVLGMATNEEIAPLEARREMCLGRCAMPQGRSLRPAFMETRKRGSVLISNKAARYNHGAALP